MAKRVKESATAEEIVAAEEPVKSTEADVPASEPKPIPESAAQEPVPPTSSPTPIASGPGFGQRVSRFFGFLLRSILVLTILAAIGVGLYFGLPLVYQKYILPVQENTNQVEQLEKLQAQSEKIIADLQIRLSELESEQARQSEMLETLGARTDEIEKEVEVHTESLETLEDMQATLQEQNTAAGAELGRQISLLKSMELLSRARLFMYQSNFGLARQDVQSARDLLATIQPDAPRELADDLTAVLLRLDLTLSNLPDFPVAASDDLDIAWQILLSGLPEASPTASALPIPAFTPTLVITLTPIPPVTIEPTATP